MGGQIMPPVMGAVAFIMAETLGVEYVEVVRAALIPAVLYFASAFWMVHLEAGRRNLRGMAVADLPSPRKALRDGWFLLLPLAVLVYLLFSGYTPLYAGTIGLALTVMLILGGTIALGLPGMVIRVVFWVGLGLIAAAFFEYGINVVLAGIGVLIAWNALSAGGRRTLILCRDSLAEGAATALPVGVACALVGVIIGTLTLTGAATTFGQFIVSVGQSSLFLSLILTMVTCIVLGMGIPTIPNYIITSSIAGPALLHLGVPLIVSHMFVFYFGILADLTPPVALACFAAAPIARESGLKISFEAIKVAAAGFVIPYMAVYTPALMLQDGGPLAGEIGYIPAVLYIVVKATLAIGLWGAAVIGWLGDPAGLADARAGDGRRLHPGRRAAADRRGRLRACRAVRRPALDAGAPVSSCLLIGATALSLATGQFTLSWEHSVEKTGWQERLAGAGGRAAPDRGAGEGVRRRHGPRPRRGAEGRLVGLDPDPAAGARSGTGRLGRHTRRLAALRRWPLPGDRRPARPADPAGALPLTLVRQNA